MKKATKLLMEMAQLEMVRRRCQYELQGYVGENARAWTEILVDATDSIKVLEERFADLLPSQSFRWDKPQGHKSR